MLDRERGKLARLHDEQHQVIVRLYRIGKLEEGAGEEILQTLRERKQELARREQAILWDVARTIARVNVLRELLGLLSVSETLEMESPS